MNVVVRSMDYIPFRPSTTRERRKLEILGQSPWPGKGQEDSFDYTISLLTLVCLVLFCDVFNELGVRPSVEWIVDGTQLLVRIVVSKRTQGPYELAQPNRFIHRLPLHGYAGTTFCEVNACGCQRNLLVGFFVQHRLSVPGHFRRL